MANPKFSKEILEAKTKEQNLIHELVIINELLVNVIDILKESSEKVPYLERQIRQLHNELKKISNQAFEYCKENKLFSCLLNQEGQFKAELKEKYQETGNKVFTPSFENERAHTVEEKLSMTLKARP